MSDPQPHSRPPAPGAPWGGPAPPFGPAAVEADGTGAFRLVARDAAQGFPLRLVEGRVVVDDTSYPVRVLRVGVGVAPARDVPGVRNLLLLPGWLDQQAAAAGAAGIEVSTTDPALRQILRDAGYGGQLRAPLCRAPAGPVRPELSAGEDRADAAHKSAALARFVGELVPAAVVSAGSSGGLSRASRWLAALSTGQLRLLELQVRPKTPPTRSPLRLPRPRPGRPAGGAGGAGRRRRRRRAGPLPLAEAARPRLRPGRLRLPQRAPRGLHAAPGPVRPARERRLRARRSA